MAIFGKKKESIKGPQTDETSTEGSSVVAKPTKKVDEGNNSFWMGRRGAGNVQNVLIKPRITEKTSIHAGAGVYTFEVSESSGKREVMKAFNKVYGKTPMKVNIMNNATKRKRTRFGIGTTKNRKKALIYLKKGDTIDYV